MKIFKLKIKTGYHCKGPLLPTMSIVCIFLLNTIDTLAEKNLNTDTIRQYPSNIYKSQNKHSFKMTTLTFGGNGVLITQINNQLAIMSGGRGSATFNNRFTVGGGGWGMPKGVEVESDEPGTYNFVKMGYGGLEFGYIFFPGKKMNFGTNILLAGGAVFKETVPESDEKSFRMFPVLEPSLYNQISLGKMFRFEVGVTYRYVGGTNLSYISGKNLSGFSIYIGFLVKACKCD
jgi:hypothetical protein